MGWFCVWNINSGLVLCQNWVVLKVNEACALHYMSLLVAASVFLLSSVKSPDKARNTIVRELQHEETNQRINAILRFSLIALCARLFSFCKVLRVLTGAYMYLQIEFCQVKPYKSFYLHHGPYQRS